MSKVSIAWGAAVAAFIAIPGWGADIVASTASIPAPKAQDRGLGALAFDSPAVVQQRANAREASLGKHHESAPIGKATRALARPPGAALSLPPATDPAQAGSPGSAVDITMFRPLSDAETAKSTSEVGEPTSALLGKVLLTTGNWFAAFSSNSGTSFSVIDPAKQFPPGGTAGTQLYCCDQTALAVPSKGLMVWLIQYEADAASNTLRLAVASGAAVAGRAWRYYDFAPANIGGRGNEWFDYPAVAFSKNYLYLTSNVYSTQGAQGFTRSVVIRIALSELVSYSALNVKYFSPADVGSIRPAQGGLDAMHFGSTATNDSLRVYTWPEGSDHIQSADVPVDKWSDGPYVATGPDGTDWTQRMDGRVTAGWESGGNVGFAWTASKGDGFPNTHVRVAIIGSADGKLKKQPHIWSTKFSYAYPAAVSGADGIVGISLFGNSASVNVSHLVGLQDSGGGWKLTSAAAGKHGPASSLWGDYLAIQPLPEHGWLTTGYTLDTGNQRSDVRIDLVEFKVKEH